MRIIKLGFGAVLACSAALAVQAEELGVMQAGVGYFPEISYAKPGDTIVFANFSGKVITIVGRDGAWVLGPLANGTQTPVTLTAEMGTDYFTAYGSCATSTECSEPNPAIAYGTVEGASEVAAISFDPPPVHSQ